MRSLARSAIRRRGLNVFERPRGLRTQSSRVTRNLLLIGVPVVGGGFAMSQYLDLSVDDALVSLGLRSGKLTDQEEKELTELTETKPIEIPKVLVEHPFGERSVLWRFVFTIRRVCYLISLLVPVCAYGAYFRIFKFHDEDVRKKWIRMVLNSMERGGCTYHVLSHKRTNPNTTKHRYVTQVRTMD